MSETVLRLEPDSAAKSIGVRLETIRQCEQYIRETMRRYDGLRAFETRLSQMGIAEQVHAIADKEAES